MSIQKNTLGFFFMMLYYYCSVSLAFTSPLQVCPVWFSNCLWQKPWRPRPLDLSSEHFDPQHSLHCLVCERDVPRRVRCSRNQNKGEKCLHKPPGGLLGFWGGTLLTRLPEAIAQSFIVPLLCGSPFRTVHVWWLSFHGGCSPQINVNTSAQKYVYLQEL